MTDRTSRRRFRNCRRAGPVVGKEWIAQRIKAAMRRPFGSTRSPELAYRTLEQKQLEIIYSALDSQSGLYKDLINAGLRQVFKKNTLIHAYANEILLNDKAKRLRASLVFLAAELFGGNREDAATFSLVYEILHTASLVHDDVMDEAKMRRGQRTLHAKYGLAPAIIAGDLMLGRCYSLLSQGAASKAISKEQFLALLRIVGDSIEACCIGQLSDIHMAERRQYGSIGNYLKMIELKTGAMIQGAVKGGAVGTGASPEQIATLGRFGTNLGMAFQIIDDSLDLLGGAAAKKSVMTDLKQGKATPMLIYALQRASRAEKKRILDAVGSRRVTKAMAKDVVDIYRKCTAIACAQELSLKYVEKARRELDQLPAGPARDRFGEILDVLGIWGMVGKA